MIGGSGEQLMLPLIAHRADWWNIGLVDVDTYRRKRDLLHRHAEAAGRDPGDMAHTFMKQDRPLPASSEDSARWLDELRPLIESGVTHFMLDFGNVTSTEPIARLAEEVIAPLNKA
jgi:hypothetical protein